MSACFLNDAIQIYGHISLNINNIIRSVLAFKADAKEDNEEREREIWIGMNWRIGKDDERKKKKKRDAKQLAIVVE